MSAAVSKSARDATAAPAHLRDLEEDVLAAVVQDPSRIATVASEVGAEHFSTAIGQRLFEAVQRLNGAGLTATVETLPERLGNYVWDRAEGVSAYLKELGSRRRIGDTDLRQMARAVRSASEERDRERPLYHDDVVAWSHEQRRLLDELSRRSDLPDVDWVNVIEEILSVGRSEVSGVVRRIELVFVHLMKAASSPNASSVGRWRQEIGLHLDRLRADYRPSMRRLIDVDRAWDRARTDATRQLDEFGERLSRSLPQGPPLTLDEIVGDANADDLVAALGNRQRG